jgi:transposase, IS30 family
LDRPASTISRELKRNNYVAPRHPRPVGRPPVAGGYRCLEANQRARCLRSVPRVPRRMVEGTPLWDSVMQGLCEGLSPEQVSGVLSQRMDSPIRISHESIYSAIYAMPRGELRSEVIALLRKSHKTRKPRARGQDRRGLIANMTSIDERPVEVSQRLVPGHWEGDLIKGAHNRSQIGTLVERTTLFTVLARVPSGTALDTANAFSTVLNRVDAQKRLSMTYDQGREMAAHAKLTQSTGVQVYFAHPHSPWERGINENTNGLLRQYFPKSTDLSAYSQEELDAVAWRLNTRPRKSLDWKCPAELFLPEGSFDAVAYWKSILTPPQPTVALRT